MHTSYYDHCICRRVITSIVTHLAHRFTTSSNGIISWHRIHGIVLCQRPVPSHTSHFLTVVLNKQSTPGVFRLSRPLKPIERERLDRLKFCLATAPSRWDDVAENAASSSIYRNTFASFSTPGSNPPSQSTS
jgi:hypothetical protein